MKSLWILLAALFALLAGAAALFEWGVGARFARRVFAQPGRYPAAVLAEAAQRLAKRPPTDDPVALVRVARSVLEMASLASDRSAVEDLRRPAEKLFRAGVRAAATPEQQDAVFREVFSLSPAAAVLLEACPPERRRELLERAAPGGQAVELRMPDLLRALEGSSVAPEAWRRFAERFLAVAKIAPVFRNVLKIGLSDAAPEALARAGAAALDRMRSDFDERNPLWHPVAAAWWKGLDPGLETARRAFASLQPAGLPSEAAGVVERAAETMSPDDARRLLAGVLERTFLEGRLIFTAEEGTRAILAVAPDSRPSPAVYAQLLETAFKTAGKWPELVRTGLDTPALRPALQAFCASIEGGRLESFLGVLAEESRKGADPEAVQAVGLAALDRPEPPFLPHVSPLLDLGSPEVRLKVVAALLRTRTGQFTAEGSWRWSSPTAVSHLAREILLALAEGRREGEIARRVSLDLISDPGDIRAIVLYAVKTPEFMPQLSTSSSLPNSRHRAVWLEYAEAAYWEQPSAGLAGLIGALRGNRQSPEYEILRGLVRRLEGADWTPEWKRDVADRALPRAEALPHFDLVRLGIARHASRELAARVAFDWEVVQGLNGPEVSASAVEELVARAMADVPTFAGLPLRASLLGCRKLSAEDFNRLFDATADAGGIDAWVFKSIAHDWALPEEGLPFFRERLLGGAKDARTRMARINAFLKVPPKDRPKHTFLDAILHDLTAQAPSWPPPEGEPIRLVGYRTTPHAAPLLAKAFHAVPAAHAELRLDLYVAFAEVADAQGTRFLLENCAASLETYRKLGNSGAPAVVARKISQLASLGVSQLTAERIDAWLKEKGESLKGQIR